MKTVGCFGQKSRLSPCFSVQKTLYSRTLIIPRYDTKRRVCRQAGYVSVFALVVFPSAGGRFLLRGLLGDILLAKRHHRGHDESPVDDADDATGLSPRYVSFPGIDSGMAMQHCPEGISMREEWGKHEDSAARTY